MGSRGVDAVQLARSLVHLRRLRNVAVRDSRYCNPAYEGRRPDGVAELCRGSLLRLACRADWQVGELLLCFPA